MSRLSEIRSGLLESIQAIPGPAFYVTTGKTTFSEGINSQNFQVIATVGERSPEAEDALDDLLDAHGASSIKTTIEANRQPHEDVIDVRVTGTSGMRLYPEPDSPPLLGAEWTVECLLEGE